jgi:hypothetical protein
MIQGPHKRPASHLLAALYLALLVALLLSIAISTYNERTQGFVSEFGGAFLFACALTLLLTVRAKWAHIVLSCFLFVFPAFLLLQIAILLWKIKPTPFSQATSGLIVDGLFLWLFYAYAFGRASTIYYGYRRATAS